MVYCLGDTVGVGHVLLRRDCPVALGAAGGGGGGGSCDGGSCDRTRRQSGECGERGGGGGALLLAVRVALVLHKPPVAEQEANLVARRFYAAPATHVVALALVCAAELAAVRLPVVLRVPLHPTQTHTTRDRPSDGS